MRSTRTHSICTSATKDVYMRPFSISHAIKIFSCEQPRTYIYVIHVLRQLTFATYFASLLFQKLLWLLKLEILDEYIYALGCSEIIPTAADETATGRIYTSLVVWMHVQWLRGGYSEDVYIHP